MVGSSEVERALEEGARRSREAARPDTRAPDRRVDRGAADPAAFVSPDSPAEEPPGALDQSGEPPSLDLVWRRHKWKILGALLFLLTELCLFTWGSTPR